jgi:putative transposase
MLRRSQISITEANPGKLAQLDRIFIESRKVINLYIDEIWKQKDFQSKFVSFKVKTWLSVRLQQCLGKQALEIVKSQRKKKKKFKPIFHSDTINLDSRFVEVQYNNNSFDIWFKIGSIGNQISLNLPGRRHHHFHKYDVWTTKKSYRLRKFNSKYFIDMIFEKQPHELKSQGTDVGIDIGYKQLIVASNGQKYDTGLETIYEKIVRKRQGSKAFKRSLIERDNKIGQSVNLLPFNEIKTIVAEDLKDVKHKSKGRIFKKFNNKLQRWSYSKVLNKLSLRCEEQGILLKKVNPAYTSQKCSSCGFTHEENRKSEVFLCLDCGNTMDADFNASRNILALGSL